MNFAPHKALGLGLGSGALLLLTAAIGVSLAQLGQGLISPTSLLWLGLLLLALPMIVLVLNRVYGLLTASYRVDRDGFYIRWGMAFEQIPITTITRVEPASEIPRRPKLGFWWPGCLVGKAISAAGTSLEYFATTGPLLVVTASSGRTLVISPPDIQAFEGAFMSAARMGSLESIAERSERADALVSGIWEDRWARGLILVGLLAPIGLMAALVVISPSLPQLVPFGFGAGGNPEPLVPPGRLLLLPFIAALIWIADLIFGAWFFSGGDDRPIAYALWGSAIAVGLLLTGAAVQLIASGT